MASKSGWKVRARYTLCP